MTNNENDKPFEFFGLTIKNKKTPRYLFGFIVGAWIISALALCLSYRKLPDDAGAFGDMFGMINALFSGLAFGGLIFTILLQMEELRPQRKELTSTREEFKKQNINIKRQRFESTFFNMIDLQQRSLGSINFKGGIGTQGLYQFMNLVYERFRQMKGQISFEEQHDVYIKALTGYTFEGFVSPYVNSLNNTYIFVKRARLNNKAERRYLSILKGYLSPIED